MLAVAFIVKLPPVEFVASMHVAKAADESKARLLRSGDGQTPSFRLAFLWLILVSSGGPGLISQAAPAAEEVLSATGMDAAASAMMATAAMGGISLCNGFGRLMCGLVWDKFGYRISFLWVSVGFALSMLLCDVAIMLSSFPLIVAGFMLLGLVYGGNMATMAVVSSSFFGPKFFGINYAVATLQMIASASAGPLVLATLQTSTGSYGPAFWAFLAVAAAALVLAFVIKSPQDMEKHASQS